MYPRLRRPPGSLKNALLHLPSFLREWRNAPGFTALQDLSFEARRGETFGICGRNGSGKSTTLSIVAGVVRPTSGSVEVRGRVSPLLELGAGFHPELTGRENVILNGVILGMRRREVLAKFDQIVEFSGLRDVIDEPMRIYSSGMTMRLGFAVAVHTDPEILLIDEVLAVGDAEFQAKCVERMEQFRRDGVTILFVSHDVALVRRICDRVMTLDAGRRSHLGPP